MVFNIMYMLLIGVGLIIHAPLSGIYSMSCDADDGWLEYEDRCFKHYSNIVPWSSAERTCSVLRNSLLATVDSPEINTFVQNNLTSEIDVWIGLSIPDISKSSWKWSDGSNTLSYDDWNMALFKSACAVMKYKNSEGQWYTRPCTEKKKYICEKEMFGDNCSNWLHFNSHCYLIVNEHKETNMAAARNCWKQEAYIISINSKPEADFIYNKIQNNQAYWIGLSPLKWVDGVPYQWNNWGNNGPTYNITSGCVYVDATSGQWFTGYCGYSNNIDDRPYICQKATVINSETSHVPEEVETSTTTVLTESNTDEFDALNMYNRPTQRDNSKQLLLTVVIPAVCGGLIAIILIIVVIIVIRRKKRSNESNKRNPPQINTTHVSNDVAVGGDNKDIDEHQDQAYCIYDEAEVVQAENGTVVVNGDVYAIVDKDKIQNHKVQDQMVSQQHVGASPKSYRKQDIADDQNHIIVGSDVYAIVDKNNVKHNKQQKPTRKKKKPQTQPKIDEKSSAINSNAPGHIVVGTDVYAVVDKDKAKPNKQQTSQQKKKKPPTPPKLENKTVAKNEGNVYYNEFDMKTVPGTPTKRKPKMENKTENTGVVYADLDLTGSGSGDRQNRNTDEESGVVYADVRG